MANNKSAIRLHEIGPRLTIELIKIQNELFTGEVLYHNAIVKTEEEIAELKKAREEKKRLKELRKKIQLENVAKKEQQKDDHKKRSLAGVKTGDHVNEEEHVDNDADYYREEVGEEPDEGMGIQMYCLFSHKQNDHLVKLMQIHSICYRTVPHRNIDRRTKTCVRAQAHETWKRQRCKTPQN